MMLKFLVLISFIYCAQNAMAADTIIVHKDPRIDVLTAKQIAINKVTSRVGSNGMSKGFRLQVLNSRSRDDAFKTKAVLLENFPDEKAYVLYQSPYFKVRIGNFLNRSDAENFAKEVRPYISQPAYVVEDMIEYVPKAEDFQ